MSMLIEVDFAPQLREIIARGNNEIRAKFPVNAPIRVLANGLGLLIVGCFGWDEALKLLGQNLEALVPLICETSKLPITPELLTELAAVPDIGVLKIESEAEFFARLDAQRPSWKRGN